MSELVFVEQNPHPGKEHEARPATIGREGCDVNVDDPEVSRSHAAIRAADGGVLVEDLDSTNGTFVNGERLVGARRLDPGDEISFGKTVWRLEARADATVMTSRPRLDADQATGAPVTRQGQPSPTPPPARPPTQPRRAPDRPSVAGTAPAAATPASSAGAGPRGDVPPPQLQPSAIRRVVPRPGGPSPFTPAQAPRSRRSSATRIEATAFCALVTILAAAGVVVYYVTKPFE